MKMLKCKKDNLITLYFGTVLYAVISYLENSTFESQIQIYEKNWTVLEYTGRSRNFYCGGGAVRCKQVLRNKKAALPGHPHTQSGALFLLK